VNRRLALGAALAATVALAAIVAAQDQPADAAVVAAVARARPAASAVAARAPDPARRSPWTEPDPAVLAAWSPPPPAPAPPPPSRAASAAPAPPPVPEFPYQWFGLLVEGGAVTAMLGNEQRSLVVRAGDTVDAQWRVERIAERRIDLVWLPTGQPVPVVPR
jgi:hypothetical protein